MGKTVLASQVGAHSCTSLKIGEVARLSGLSVKTIRYYEDIGLLAPTVERSRSGYRIFDVLVIKRLAFIKRAQSLGLSLEEIKPLLERHDQGELPCPDLKQQLQTKILAITSQIEALRIRQIELQAIIEFWQDLPSNNHLSQTICPNIQV